MSDRVRGPSPWSAIKRTDSGPSPWSESESVVRRVIKQPLRDIHKMSSYQSSFLRIEVLAKFNPHPLVHKHGRQAINLPSPLCHFYNSEEEKQITIEMTLAEVIGGCSAANQNITKNGITKIQIVQLEQKISNLQVSTPHDYSLSMTATP
ncbi:hypothetical protein LXL04_016532 [Taraxacum kok-saghyz]